MDLSKAGCVSSRQALAKMQKEQIPEDSRQRQLPKSPVLRAILNFAPSWFQVVMSTGIVSILLHIAPHRFPGMATIGTVLYIANVCLLLVFTMITIARFVFFPWAFLQMFRHPAQSLFLGTIPMGLATVCNATVLIAVPAYGQWAINLAWVLWWIDVVLSVLSTCVMPTVMFELQKHSIETMTRAWFLPIVPCVVAAALSGEVASVLPRPHALITLIVGYVLWGIGVSMSFLIMGLYLHRMASYHHLPNPEAMGSAFVPVGPCGQGAYGLILIAQAGQTVFSESDFAGQADSGRLIMHE
ncbi:hypothetical protein WJX73_010716 [Symbiochloris irregularis]|uniref:C4-dicarboxylate transporter/malic acid transport protein n=1 Tax=Symbiochloris irregularis TaxID=706552 RepID=A0AAW1PG15_9CHLO